MKNPKMNKRNKLPLLLGILLLISAAAYGTRAYFTDSATEQANIKLNLGTLSIKSNSENWNYNNADKDQVSAVKDGNSYSNVSSGDTFTKHFSFKNEGSLNAYVKITQNLIQLSDKKDIEQKLKDKIYAYKDTTFTYLKEPYKIEIKFADPDDYKYFVENKTLVLSKDQTFAFDATISLDDKNYNKDDLSGKELLDLMETSIMLEATDK